MRLQGIEAQSLLILFFGIPIASSLPLVLGMLTLHAITSGTSLKTSFLSFG